MKALAWRAVDGCVVSDSILINVIVINTDECEWDQDAVCEGERMLDGTAR